ncbi:MAG: oligoendopeptidase F [Gammaproteobacteria bacterium]|nr:oligoendopeptidase F [Gammaproteobacteria bacterium]MBQ0840482.1 oligoendopeptidase F [Gammaproteobacteria bacterium]
MRMTLHSPFSLKTLGFLLALTLSLALSLGLHASASVSTPAPQTPVVVPGVWDLSELYPDIANWEEERAKIPEQLASLENCRGKLGSSARRLAQCLAINADTYRNLARLYTYSFLNKDTDLGNSQRREQHALIENLMTRYEESSSFIAPELLLVGKHRLEKFLNPGSFPGAKNALQDYDFFIRNILRQAPHVLSEPEEKLLAAAGSPLATAAETYSILTNAEIPWPELALPDGQSIKLNPAAYTRYRSNPSRELRKEVFDSFFGSYQSYAQTLAVTLEGQIKAHIFEAKARHYPSSLERALAADNIPQQVYLSLVSTVNENLSSLHRYLALRAKLMGIEDPAYYDVYPAVSSIDRPYSIAASQQQLTLALAPLGEEYQQLQQRAAAQNWMHVYPAPGKRSGAYMMGAAYDVHPYLLLNHNDNFESLSTYAHEWGHAMHSLLANKAQPFSKAEYATFIAEIASTSHEVLLMKYLQDNASGKEEKLFYLLQELQSLRGTFFRQTQFAEFELAIHQRVENGEALSADRLNTLYGDLLKRYYGHGEGVMTIDQKYTVEWAYIPHFYRNFYVYQYATSISAAYYLMEKVQSGGAEERDNYLSILRAGGSDYPYDILKKAGVDMASPEVYAAVIRRFEQVMDEIEALSL